MAGQILVTGADGFADPHLLAELGGERVLLDADVTDANAVVDAIAATSLKAIIPPIRVG